MVGHGRGRSDGGIARQGKARQCGGNDWSPCPSPPPPLLFIIKCLDHVASSPSCRIMIEARNLNGVSGTSRWERSSLTRPPRRPAPAPLRQPTEFSSCVLADRTSDPTHSRCKNCSAHTTPPTHNPCQCLQPGSEIGLELGTGDETASNAGLRHSAASSPTTDDRELYIFHLARHALKTCRFRGREKQSPH